MHKRPTTRDIEQLAFLDLDTHSPCRQGRPVRSPGVGLVGGRADRPAHGPLDVQRTFNGSMDALCDAQEAYHPTDTRDIDHFFTVLSKSKISASAGDFDIDH